MQQHSNIPRPTTHNIIRTNVSTCTHSHTHPPPPPPLKIQQKPLTLQDPPPPPPPPPLISESNVNTAQKGAFWNLTSHAKYRNTKCEEVPSLQTYFYAGVHNLLLILGWCHTLRTKPWDLTSHAKYRNTKREKVPPPQTCFYAEVHSSLPILGCCHAEDGGYQLL